MSATSSHGRNGRGRNQSAPLRRPTRSESNKARRQLKGWRARKLGWVAVGLPVTLIAVVGVAMASPHHHQQQNAGLPACVSAGASSTGAAGGAAGAAAATTSSAAAAGNGGANNGGANNGGANNGAANNGGANNAGANNGATSTGTATDGTVTGQSNRLVTAHVHHTQTAGAGNGAAASTSAAAGAGTGSAAAGTTAAAATTTAAKACASSSAAAATTSAAAAAAATPNPNCTLIVPANPTSAAGLATPFQLVATNAAMGACHEANANQSAFAEAAIITGNGQLTLYDPLVIDQGTQPAAPTVPAQVPAGSTVAIWFGFNGTNLTLQSAAGTNALAAGNCVNGSQGSIFGQFSYCNAPAFFQSANNEIGANMLQVPAVGTATDGLPCPTTRDFSLVDQDQSDNVVTHYLANANGQTAQKNAASMAAIGANAVDLANGSDNLLLNKFVDPALGCTPFTKPDLSSDGQASGALPLDELSAAANQQAPIATVPLNDPMTLNNANASTNKTNLYRAGVDQGQIGAGGDNGNGATYCTNLFGTPQGIARVFKDMTIFQNNPSVDAAMATNLFTFLSMRASQSYTNLGCQGLLNKPNPIALTTSGAGVVTAAVMVALGQTPPQVMAGAGGGAAATTPAATTPAAGAATPTPTPTMTMRMKPKKVRW